MLGLEQRLNSTIKDARLSARTAAGESPEDVAPAVLGDEKAKFDLHLPVVNPTAFLLALEAASASLAEDLEELLVYLRGSKQELPKRDDPLRFQKLVDLVFSTFALKKNPEDV